MNTKRVYVARRKDVGIEANTYATFDWECFSKMRKEMQAPYFDNNYPFIDIVSYELKDPTIEVTFALQDVPIPTGIGKGGTGYNADTTGNLLYDDSINIRQGTNSYRDKF